MGLIQSRHQLLPPYVTYRTFSGYLDFLKENGIPARIDPSALPGLSSTVQRQLTHALRYLDLIDDDGTPLESLNELVQSDGSQRQAFLSETLERSYSFLLGSGRRSFDLTKATPAQLAERFQAAGLSGDTVRKSQSFFLSAANDAGITVSPLIKALKERGGRTHRSRGQGARRAVPRGPGPAEEVGQLAQGEVLQIRTEAAQNPRAAYMVQILLGKFPSFSVEWTHEAQIKWFIAFERLMELVDRYLG
jgi:hypothetical protein